MKKTILFFLVLLVTLSSNAQVEDSLVFNKKRFNAYLFTGIGIYSATMISLNELWYKDSRSTRFRWINDNDEFLQMDKIGHANSAYYTSYGIYAWFKSCNVSENKAILIGAATSTIFQSTIEVMDGFSEGWGASSGDVIANTFGTSLFVGQQLAWGEQKVLMKVSSTPSEFSKYRPKLLGSSFAERLMKDYNGQTYWFSANVNTIFKNSKLPPWLNIAVGYGATGMLTGSVGVCNDCPPNLPHFERYRQYYLSLDIDLRKIPTKSKFLKTVFESIGFLKIPSPTIEFNKHGVKPHLFYY